PLAASVRRLSRAAVARSPDHQSVRVVLADVEPAGVARPVAARPCRPRAPDRRSGEREVGNSRQARSGQHQRARVVSRARWVEPVADAVLLGEAGIGKFATTEDAEDTEVKSGYERRASLFLRVLSVLRGGELRPHFR